MSRDHLGLFDTPPNRGEIRFGLAIVGLLIAAFLLILPVRDIRLREIDAFVPIIDAVMFLGELITAALLYAQAVVLRSQALVVLATAYVLGALLLVPHALTFPGAFAPNGLLGAGFNTAVSIYVFRRASFAIAVVLYVLLRRAESAAQPATEPVAARIAVGVVVAIGLSAAMTGLAAGGPDLLPPLYLDRFDLIHANAVRYESVVFTLVVVATVVLFRQRNSVLDTWLLVAFSGWMIQSLLIMTFHGRFTAGWYCLFAIILFSHLVVLFALIAESIRLYARLAVATAARNREQDARLMSMSAVAAAISHEIGQPLTAVTSNAGAALRWLSRPQPDPEKAMEALRYTIEAAHHSFDVIKNIRAIFAKGSHPASQCSLNDIVRETASLLHSEMAAKKVSLELELDEALPSIRADRVQMQQVLLNLLTNAIESVGAVRGRGRRIAIRSVPVDGEDVLIEVSDTGVGIAPGEMEQIFDPFFTTKSSGTGLGLMLCRTFAEEHGGRLWASQGEEYGATFHLQLPRSGLPAQ